MSNKDSSNLKDSNGLVGWLSGQKHLPCEPENLSPCWEPMVKGKNRLPKIVLWPPCVYSVHAHLHANVSIVHVHAIEEGDLKEIPH